MLRLECVFFRYFRDWVIKDLHWDLALGKWVTIVGDMGSGKTTLSRLIKGILQPQRGRVSFLDAEVEGPLPPQLIALVEADPSIHVLGATVEEDIAFSLAYQGTSSAVCRELIEEALTIFGLYDLKDHPIHLLSGGEQQRAALAAAWVASPTLWLLDEALAMVEPRYRAAFLELLRCPFGGGTSAGLIMTHDHELACWADECWKLEEGRLIRHSASNVRI